jgi:hypothetical protein
MLGSLVVYKHGTLKGCDARIVRGLYEHGTPKGVRWLVSLAVYKHGTSKEVRGSEFTFPEMSSDYGC